MKTIEVIDRFNIPHLIPIKKIDHVYTYEERDGELIKEHTMIVTASKNTIDTYIPYDKFKEEFYELTKNTNSMLGKSGKWI